MATLKATESSLLQLVDGTLLNSHRRFQRPVDELQYPLRRKILEIEPQFVGLCLNFRILQCVGERIAERAQAISGNAGRNRDRAGYRLAC